ncbi:macro domain-containing protein [Holdemanella biformis]|uniref:macro domain-containing protein n=1 Tax=Holdemanella biformis TaxID=1735 RepID=UPI003AB6325A
MPIKIIRQDITKLKVDAIVNTTNPSFDATGGLDHYIHQLAGKELDVECRRIGKLKVGQACLTSGYKLCKYIIHTASPVWNIQNKNNEALLKSCYLSSLMLANEYKLKSIAFPLISSGTNQFPKELALQVAMHSIVSFLTDHEMMVYLVVYDRNSYKISSELFDSIEAYIDDYYEDEHMLVCNSIIAPRFSLIDALNKWMKVFQRCF